MSRRRVLHAASAVVSTASALAVGLGVLVTPAVGSARALEPGVRFKATVVSVDGPRDLTLRRGEHALIRVRLDGIDVPRSATSKSRAECGAGVATAALRRVAPRASRLAVFAYGMRDGGRELISANTIRAGRESAFFLSEDLVDRGGARPGLAIALTSPTIPNTDLTDLSYAPVSEAVAYSGEDAVDAARAGLGVWGACGGRFHLAGGAKVPPVQPARWVVGADARTAAVGALAPSPNPQDPGGATRMRDAAAVFDDLEFVRDYTGQCVGVSGAAGLRFQTGETPDDGAPARRPCGDQAVQSVASLAASASSIGLRVGDRSTDITGRFPAAAINPKRTRYVELDGAGDLVPAPWRTAVLVERDHVAAFFTRLTDTADASS